MHITLTLAAASGLRVPHSTKPVAALPSPQQEGLSLLQPTWSNALGAGGGATCGFLPLAHPLRPVFPPFRLCGGEVVAAGALRSTSHERNAAPMAGDALKRGSFVKAPGRAGENGETAKPKRQGGRQTRWQMTTALSTVTPD